MLSMLPLSMIVLPLRRFLSRFRDVMDFFAFRRLPFSVSDVFSFHFRLIFFLHFLRFLRLADFFSPWRLMFSLVSRRRFAADY